MRNFYCSEKGILLQIKPWSYVGKYVLGALCPHWKVYPDPFLKTSLIIVNINVLGTISQAIDGFFSNPHNPPPPPTEVD